MTVKDKFLKASRIDGFLNNEEVIAATNATIADDFAIGFAEWCKQEYDVENTSHHNKWLDVDGAYLSTRELLEIYKKEKGL